MDYITIGFVTSLVLLVVFAYVTMWFVIAIAARRADIAPMAWGLGISLVAMTAFVVSGGGDVRMSMLAAVAFLWGTRLSLHVWQRSTYKPTDVRYEKRRAKWGAWYMPRTYAQIFLLQGLLMVLIGYPFIHAAAYSGVAFDGYAVAGLILWIIGFAIEGIADKQMRDFTSKPENKGKICSTGLWRYSRHPNYFGEILLWWGVGVVLLGVPYGYVALVSPLVITVLLLLVSGIPPLERRMKQRPGYREYAERTEPLLPLPPKN